MIDRHKTGEIPPGNLHFEEWGKPHDGSTNSLAAPSPGTRKTLKPSNSSMFGMSRRKKETLVNDNIANDFADLPPAQRRKKFNKTIASLEENIRQLEKSKAGMLKIIDTSKQFGGDIASIQGQIDVNEKELQRVKNLLHQYQCYLAAMDSEGGQRNSIASRPVSNADYPPPSVDVVPPGGDFPPPPVEKPDSIQAPPLSPEFGNDEFDDELRCSVLYDFSGTNEGEMSVYAGEELLIVDDDDGGWTRVIRGDEEGYIPTAYINKL